MPRSPGVPRSAPPRPAALPRSPSGSAVPLRRRAPRLVLRAVLVTACLLMSWLALPEARSEGGRWQWPMDPPHSVVRAFEPPAHDYGPGHRGIDIGAPGPGTAVRAVEAGTVHFAGTVAGRGVLSLRHSDGLLSTYEPVITEHRAGDQVAAGEVIAQISVAADGTEHCPGATCLHLGARRGTDYIDPMLLLGGRGPSVLLPWGGGPTTAERSTEPAARSGRAARSDSSTPAEPSAATRSPGAGRTPTGSARARPGSGPQAVLLE